MVQIMQQVTFQFQLQYGQKQILFCCICSYTQQQQQDTLAATFVPFVVWPRCEISWNDSTTEMSQNLHKGTASHDSLTYNNSQVQGWNLQLWISVSSLLMMPPLGWNSTFCHAVETPLIFASLFLDITKTDTHVVMTKQICKTKYWMWHDDCDGSR